MIAPTEFYWPGRVFSSLMMWLPVWVLAAPDRKSEPKATQVHSHVREETKRFDF